MVSHLFVVDRCWLPAWRGYPRIAEAGTVSDYERACAIDEPLGLLTVGTGYGLVLGDEPLSTTWQPDNARRGGMIVHWRYGPDGPTTIAALARLPDDIWNLEAFSLPLPSGQAKVFDSAHGGERERATLTLTLIPGTYRLETAEYAPGADLALLLHRLTWVEAAPDQRYD